MPLKFIAPTRAGQMKLVTDVLGAVRLHMEQSLGHSLGGFLEVSEPPRLHGEAMACCWTTVDGDVVVRGKNMIYLIVYNSHLLSII